MDQATSEIWEGRSAVSSEDAQASNVSQPPSGQRELSVSIGMQ